MNDRPTSLEPLADYLEPQFGNIYEYNIVDAVYDVQQWTDELRRAIKHYLLHEASEDLVNGAFGRDGDVSPDERVEQIISDYQPWEVAHALHLEVVRSFGTLDELIGHLSSWSNEDERWDAQEWLDSHSSEAQLRQMIIASGHSELLRRGYVGNLGFELLQILEPLALLQTWNDVAGSAPSDLTDAEWKLIKPFIPAVGNSGRTDRTRSALNGMFYKFASDVLWTHIPARYGVSANVYQRHRNYLKGGIFARMLEVLQDKPEAARLVEWLRAQIK
jgi:transposase